MKLVLESINFMPIIVQYSIDCAAKTIMSMFWLCIVNEQLNSIIPDYFISLNILLGDQIRYRVSSNSNSKNQIYLQMECLESIFIIAQLNSISLSLFSMLFCSDIRFNERLLNDSDDVNSNYL